MVNISLLPGNVVVNVFQLSILFNFSKVRINRKHVIFTKQNTKNS